MINKFLHHLQEELGKNLILIGQCFDGASSMRFQAQGHVRSRINAFAMYIQCRSHLVNLAVKDTLKTDFTKSHELMHKSLVFLRDSPQRLNILKNAQIVLEKEKEGENFFPSVPKGYGHSNCKTGSILMKRTFEHFAPSNLIFSCHRLHGSNTKRNSMDISSRTS